ncbi:MAG: hypothetical protein ACH36H_07610 [Candidatus Nanopelagicales bacterium]
MIDAVKSYVQMASGILEATAAKAKQTAEQVVSQGMESGTRAPEQMAGQLALIAEDLMEQSRTNRELVVGLVRTEVDRAVGRVGFVREEELAAVRAHVDRLEGQLREAVDKVGDLPGVAQVAGLAADSAEAAEEAAETAAESAAAVARSAKTLTETTALRAMNLEHTAPDVTDLPAQKTVVRAPAAKKAPAKKPAAKRAAKKPVADKPAAKKPVADKPAAKKPAAKKPAAE